MAWYRLYRPKKIAELSITSVREALERMMQNGKIPQALLFAGPKGTGKTSASRIIGAMLNDPANAELIDYLFFKKPAPKKTAFQEPDITSAFAQRVYEGHSFVVQELDAASNRRIDDIRLLREKINLPPAEGKMMVYILDEVHMLTTEAFNALLKILEEPPAHVVFILATTELHKIPGTIISRCSVLNFRKATIQEIQVTLSRILEAEQITYQEEDLQKIALRADGSLRDGVKILEMACQKGRLDLKSINNLLASDNESYIKQCLEAVINKDSQALVQILQTLRDNNAQQRDFYKDFFEFLHQDLLKNLEVISGAAQYSLKIDQFFLKELLSIDLYQETPIPFLVLELKFLEIIERSQKNKNETSISSAEPPSKQTIKKQVEKVVAEKVLSAVEASKNSSATNKKKIQPISLELSDFWQKFLQAFAPDNFSLLTLLKSCKLVSLSEGVLEVYVYYQFHKEQLEQNKNQALLNKVASQLSGTDLQFNFVLQQTTLVAEQPSQDPDLLLAARDSLL